MLQNTRLIIPLWGKAYADKLVSMTLPALLAPGNLPALCTMFNVEVVIVTETKLFDFIRNSSSFQRLALLCPVRLTPLDDIMSNIPGDYGVVLTNALYRGFLDLGEKVTETYLLFLNADFIIADGSYRHLGNLMLAGHRVIHSPSFRVVLEEVWPKLEARVDDESAVLVVPPRELVKLALDHKHLTVKARTVNQQLYHQWCMDQFYWYVDESTLIGYQWPVALVAIRPERVLKEPTLVWDFAYLPDAAPTLKRHFIQDSDDFFMLEPQSKLTGEELIRLGWITPDQIAKFLNDWTTKEQRECGQQLLILHAGELTPDLGQVVEESRRYMSEITRRLSPRPQPHVNHRMLGAWFADTTRRIKDGRARAAPGPETAPEASALTQATSGLQQKLFGILPFLRRTHPLWPDTTEVATKLSAWHRSGRDRILWVSSRDSFFRSLLSGPPHSLQAILKGSGSLLEKKEMIYDACFCELSLSELVSVPALYATVRQLVGDGGEIFIYVHTLAENPLRVTPIDLYDELFPAVDVSTIRFHGNAATRIIRKLYFKLTRRFSHRPALRALVAALGLFALAPFAWLANSQAARRDASKFAPGWTSAVVHFVVKKTPKAPPAAEMGQIGRESDGRAQGRTAPAATMA
jgi:hypothetical protein